MARLVVPSLLVALTGAFTFGLASGALACDGAGVIVRIDGQPQDVQITRIGPNGPQVVSRPRVLEVVCRGDVIRSVGATAISMSIDGVGPVKVDRASSYTVPPRTGAPSAMGNAYRSINEQVMPDMKRLPWNVRLKGAGDDFGFALPALGGGGQQITAGERPLVVRLVGGTAPYRVEIRDLHGRVAAAQTSESHEVQFPATALAPGSYTVTAADSTPRSLCAAISVVSDPPPAHSDFADLPDPEVRTAASATELARDATATWSFEAEQQLASAPRNGLDRDKVYELIESYSAQ
jgi:hypothetical protein